MFLTAAQVPTAAPKRIISLVPSQTELLHYLGLEAETVGITKFCVHPSEWFLHKQRVGGTKTINIEKIKALHPDLIIANKEENVQEQIEELAKFYPVLLTDVNTLSDAYQMISDVGRFTHRHLAATDLIRLIESKFALLKKDTAKAEPQISACYLIWKDPYMTVGSDNFINDMMQEAGFKNAFAAATRYPVVSMVDIQHCNCEVLLLSSEPYPFQQKHVDELQQFLPHVKIMVVDGEMFSWYGSRLLKAPNYLSALRQQLCS